MVINLLMLTPSIYMLQVYDRVLPSRNQTTLFMLSGIMLGLYALSAGIEFVRARLVIQISEALDARLARRVYQAAFERNLSAAGQPAGPALADLATLRAFLTGPALFALLDAPWFPVYLAVIFLFDPALGWFALGGTVVLVALAWLNEAWTRDSLKEAAGAAFAAGNQATNTLRNAEAIHAMGMLGALRERWERPHDHALGLQSRASVKSAAISALSRMIRLAEQSMVLGLGALLALNNELTPGMMIAASILAGRAMAPVDQLVASSRQWATARSSWSRLRDLLCAHPSRPTPHELPAPRGHLSLQQACVATPAGGREILRDITLTLEPGDVLGVVGATGSGKSSLARLMLGVWPASSGQVRLDGAELSQWDRDRLGSWIGYLPQDVELFEGTVAQNIARFAVAAPEAVIAASKLAGVHELILQLPQGYDTVLGDGGAGLSGGQRQRIALARALFGEPRLVVLDEPNSNLDDVGEQALLVAISQFSRRKQGSLVLITHRATTLAVATKLLVMRDGRIQWFGPREEVIARMAQANAAARAGAAAPTGSLGANA